MKIYLKTTLDSNIFACSHLNTLINLLIIGISLDGMEGTKQRQLNNLLRRDDTLIGIIVAEKESAIPVLTSYNPLNSEMSDRHRPLIASTITLMRNSNKLGNVFIMFTSLPVSSFLCDH